MHTHRHEHETPTHAHTHNQDIFYHHLALDQFTGLIFCVKHTTEAELLNNGINNLRFLAQMANWVRQLGPLRNAWWIVTIFNLLVTDKRCLISSNKNLQYTAQCIIMVWKSSALNLKFETTNN